MLLKKQIGIAVKTLERIGEEICVNIRGQAMTGIKTWAAEFSIKTIAQIDALSEKEGRG